MAEPPFQPETLNKAKAQNLGHLLFRSARLLNELGVARVRRLSGHTGLRAAHMQVLPHLDLDGTRLTELARRMGISKQAAGQLIDDLEQMGVVERVADPHDARARQVRFTAAGKAGLLVGLGVLQGLERELSAAAGAETIERLVADLARLLPVLEALVAQEEPTEP